MNKKTLNIISIIALVIFLSIIVYFLFVRRDVKNYANQKDTIEDQNIINTEKEAAQGDVFCKENNNYLVVIKGSETGVSDFLIKNKTTSNKNVACSYNVDETDFELKNLEATYFLALTDNFLVLDIGTGPEPRGLIVYDLNTSRQVFTDQYSDLMSVTNDNLNYWDSTSQLATVDNCPELNEYLSGGLGATIETKVSLNLNTLLKKELGELRCVPRQ